MYIRQVMCLFDFSKNLFAFYKFCTYVYLITPKFRRISNRNHSLLFQFLDDSEHTLYLNYGKLNSLETPITSRDIGDRLYSARVRADFTW